MTTTRQQDALLAAVSAGVRIVELGQPHYVGMPGSPNHPQLKMALLRRHGDAVRANGGSGSNELIVIGGHVGTHVDALAHVAKDGVLHGGVRAEDAVTGGLYTYGGAEQIPPMIRRGVLFDIPRLRGVDVLAAGVAVTPSDLERHEEQTGVRVGPGDVALIRTGWSARFGLDDSYVGLEDGVPGCDEDAARWLASRHVVACGGDSTAFEHIPPGVGHSLLPAHLVLIVEAGIYIIEHMNLEALAETGVVEFTFAMLPLRLTGVTGSPVRPVAVLPA